MPFLRWKKIKRQFIYCQKCKIRFHSRSQGKKSPKRVQCPSSSLRAPAPADNAVGELDGHWYWCWWTWRTLMLILVNLTDRTILTWNSKLQSLSTRASLRWTPWLQTPSSPSTTSFHSTWSRSTTSLSRVDAETMKCNFAKHSKHHQFFVWHENIQLQRMAKRFCPTGAYLRNITTETIWSHVVRFCTNWFLASMMRFLLLCHHQQWWWSSWIFHWSCRDISRGKFKFGGNNDL